MYDVALPSGTLHRHTPTTGGPHANRRQGLVPGCAGCVSTGYKLYHAACNKQTETRPGLHETMPASCGRAHLFCSNSHHAPSVSAIYMWYLHACGCDFLEFVCDLRTNLFLVRQWSKRVAHAAERVGGASALPPTIHPPLERVSRHATCLPPPRITCQLRCPAVHAHSHLLRPHVLARATSHRVRLPWQELGEW